MPRTPLFRSLMTSLTKAIEMEISLSDIQISRRKGLQIGTVSAMAAYLHACASTYSKSALTQQHTFDSSQDITIVGGGAAGLSAAYYLKKSGIGSHVYEATERLGGRIYTQYEFNSENMFCERGGELVDTGHKEIQSLMGELGLELQLLPDPVRIREAHFFDGQWHKNSELIEAFRPLAKRIADDSSEFVVDGVFRMPTYKDPLSDRVKALDMMTLKTYLDSASDICPKWILEFIRVAYVGEYGLEAEEQSAINLVSLIDTALSGEFKVFGESDELFRIKGGNSMLIKGLTESLTGQYSTSHELQSISRSLDGMFQLLFKAGNKIVEVKTRTCIICIPFTVLRGIKGIDALGLSRQKLKAIRELGYGTNSKLMLGFKSRYWHESDKSFPANDGALLSDLPFQGGWDTSRKQDGVSGIFTNFMGGKIAETFTPKGLQKNLDDLNKAYPGIAALYDTNKVVQVWASVPTAKGSYICPKPGQYTSLLGCLGEPECEGQLLFAGEHTSEVSSGFMNGAVESGLRAATSLISSIPHVKTKGA
ncbi:MAG: FAD-dependent oxidoreductase [Chitinophagaceae bacterium]|nr:FAD-dependent oxidoreductase [Oligoflexus sp.]